MTKVYELTHYPAIFKHCYWGSFDRLVNKEITDQIIDNRDNFVSFYKIKCYKMPCYIYRSIYDEINGKQYHFYDHIECYKTYDNDYILICSPYGEYDEQFNELGWTKIDKLYSEGAYTYMKIIEFKYKKY